MRIVALYSIKGGVGKTAAAVNLSYLAARDHFRTLLCDLDPQGSASFYFRIRPMKKFSGKKFLKGGQNIDRNIRGTDFENLHLLPSKLSFRNLDLNLDSKKKSKHHLGKILQPFAEQYDLIFLDSPPNLTLLAENIFTAAHRVLVPVIPTTLSMLTYEKLQKFFRKKAFDASKVLAFFSMIESRKSMHNEIIEQNREAPFLQSQIPYLSDVEKMGIHRQPLLSYAADSRAAHAYESLWSELKQEL